ncbi:hypothetical protein, unknown function [Leishmania tarentolae]|uniref:Uncharacterized protein n=1 Tax=Leishmania tarentolae TaxID=5689 RepID=A0A640KNZ6_LEITA|nr:hypothetical protein, unknown function [Leishmania tarentolae]
MNSCLECCFSAVCQLSRQLNMLYNKPEVHLPAGLLMT